MKTASKKHQQEFWKSIAITLEKLLKNNNKNFWVSTHGFGVNYLHVRICNYPKYYGNSKLL